MKIVRGYQTENEMKISDQNVWQDWVDNNKDFYGKSVIDYAERWANMMEEKNGRRHVS